MAETDLQHADSVRGWRELSVSFEPRYQHVITTICNYSFVANLQPNSVVKCNENLVPVFVTMQTKALIRKDRQYADRANFVKSELLPESPRPRLPTNRVTFSLSRQFEVLCKFCGWRYYSPWKITTVISNP